MGLFDFLKPKSDRRFVTQNDFETNRSRQMQMCPETIGQLREIDVSEQDELRLEYFFYTNRLDNAARLSIELEKMDYSVTYEEAASDHKLFVITGWTSKMKMSNDTVGPWTSAMCELGYKFDCEFDGWGTTPEQD